MARRIMLVITVGVWIFLIVMFSLFGAEQLNRHRLWRAIENDNLGYIEDYARRGKDLNIRHLISRETPLLYAMRLTKKEVYRVLLNAGADPNAGHRTGPTLVHYAATECALRMARFRGTTKDEFIDQRQVHGHAFQILEEASLFLQRHVAVAGWFEEGKWERQERPQVPFVALREAVVNAICHRDYAIAGGAVHVAIYDDRLEIISSGLLPPGITVADLKRDHSSRLRTPLIAEPFYRRALIEKWGRGTQKIVEIFRPRATRSRSSLSRRVRSPCGSRWGRIPCLRREEATSRNDNAGFCRF